MELQTKSTTKVFNLTGADHINYSSLSTNNTTVIQEHSTTKE
jgi:hypothetical protein